uniref:MYND-type domain-containing protein n=1 Tax=Chromera velia CCMP2878 TaxID=1169474 RepID=A0A0G4FN66_9ALVE|eukprot:Cvel_3534.t1-p1 / transcript=Cvel_3534.t1 / gene=Cvel_3534 / organism=Chromera_velia_CCMP2878 / gene_product=Ankyrin repeat and MYND domain-containing protein 2, putative / transcript_product=Ankyrin repeat and MYND domain-containing protein 2, putative / location=Cvel_scaffold144:20777-22423(-) / protein_length=549 / sequence_SO=supercontig / SO=protein_coding / is_pseudo=false
MLVCSVERYLVVECFGPLGHPLSQMQRADPSGFIEVVDDLLLIKDFFHSILWMFCGGSARQRKGVYPSGVVAMAADLLKLLMEAKPHLCHIVLKSTAFKLGLKNFFPRLGHTYQHVTSAFRLVKVLVRFGGLSRQTVESLNCCAPADMQKKENASLEFAPVFRALWKISREDHTTAYDRIWNWGGAVSEFEWLGMSTAIKQAHKSAFAAADSAAEARSLFDDAVCRWGKRKMETGDDWQCARHQLLFTVKAILMSLQNRKVAERVRKDGKKIAKLLASLERSWTEVIKQDENMNGAVSSTRYVFKFEEGVMRKFLGLLHVYLDPNPSAHKGQSQDAKCSCCTPLHRHLRKAFPRLSEQPLHSLYDFLEQQILTSFEAGRTLEVGQETPPFLVSSNLQRESAANSPPPAPSQKEYAYRNAMCSRRQVREAWTIPCEKCGKETPQAQMHCKVCELAVYCSRECQKAHWNMKGPDGGGPSPSAHKRRCALLQERVLKVLLRQCTEAKETPENEGTEEASGASVGEPAQEEKTEEGDSNAALSNAGTDSLKTP